MSAPPYMKLYVGDYLGDTHHLGALEHGAYLLLLMAMWRAGGSLPATDANLAKLARCSPDQWAEIKDTILPFFRRRGGRLMHKRIDAELTKYQNTSGKRSEAGKMGARRKSRKNNEEAEANALSAESNCRHNQNQNQNHIEDAVASSDAREEEVQGKASRRKPERPIPDGFPDQAAFDEAERLGAEHGVVFQTRTEAERFRNHALQNDRRCRDWVAAWRNWLLKARDRAPKRSAGTAPGPGDETALWAFRIGKWNTEGYWSEERWGPEPGEPGCLIPAHLRDQLKRQKQLPLIH